MHLGTPTTLLNEEDFVNPTKTGETVEGNLDVEVTRLFDEARGEIEKINEKAKRQKKQIVVDLAKDLEGKIAKTPYAWRLLFNCVVKYRRTLRECLGEKYKQKTRVKTQEAKDNSNRNLTPVTI